jgi:hypothetical protein
MSCRASFKVEFSGKSYHLSEKRCDEAASILREMYLDSKHFQVTGATIEYSKRVFPFYSRKAIINIPKATPRGFHCLIECALQGNSDCEKTCKVVDKKLRNLPHDPTRKN